MEKKEWEISTDVSITDKSTKWRNLFHYGNSNRIRAPAMWLWPNDTWRFHFRIKTSKQWNDGVDFYVPKQFRIPGKDFNLRIQHKENKNSSKFIVYINNGTLAQANKVNNVTSNQNNNILEWSKKIFRKY